MVSFNQLGLSTPVLKALSELGFETPTEIQALAIPKLLDGDHDFIGLAQTGTGKTAAFGLPLLEKIDAHDKATQALILAPTRELGQQIAQQLSLYSKYLPKVNVLPVYGGAAIHVQIKALRKPQQIIIATPGRLLDLIKRKAVKLGQVKYLVLDEADEMLNMGFKEDLDEILSHTPADRCTWLFSATMSRDIRRIVKKFMGEPLEIKLNTKNEVNVNIEHQYVTVRAANKPDALMRFLDLDPEMRGLAFCRTKVDTQRLADFLVKHNYRADALHGDLSQRQRDDVMRKFKKHELHVLIATDVAARGIDVNDLTHVFHYTLPDDIAYYTHRSGRTARAGKQGISLSFVNGREVHKIRRLSKHLDIAFEAVRIPDAADIQDKLVDQWCMSILEQRTKGKIDKQLIDKANLMFGNLSKEELTAKVLTYELEKTTRSSTADLNEPEEYRRHEHQGRHQSKRRPHHGKKSGHRKGGKRKFGSKRSH